MTPNERAVRAYVDAYNEGDHAAIALLCTPDAMIHGVLGSGGLDVVIPIWRELRSSFRQYLHIEELIEQGDSIAVRYTESGKFQQDFRGQKPTGKPYSIPAIEWFHLRDGKIACRFAARDSASILRQIT